MSQNPNAAPPSPSTGPSAHHEGSTHVADARHRLHGELAEQRQHKVLQQAMPEHAHCWQFLPGLQWPTPKSVLHWWPHLQHRIEEVGACKVLQGFRTTQLGVTRAHALNEECRALHALGA